MAMIKRGQKILSMTLAVAVLFQTTIMLRGSVSFPGPQVETEGAVVAAEQRRAADFALPPPLDKVEEMPSIEVAALAEKFDYAPKDVQARIKALKDESETREKAYSNEAKASDKQVEALEKQLSKLPTTKSD